MRKGSIDDVLAKFTRVFLPLLSASDLAELSSSVPFLLLQKPTSRTPFLG